MCMPNTHSTEELPVEAVAQQQHSIHLHKVLLALVHDAPHLHRWCRLLSSQAHCTASNALHLDQALRRQLLCLGFLCCCYCVQGHGTLDQASQRGSCGPTFQLDHVARHSGMLGWLLVHIYAAEHGDLLNHPCAHICFLARLQHQCLLLLVRPG
jgi:hypothetical protein